MEMKTIEPSADGAAVLNLGVALGQTLAMGMVAGRCTAAQVAGMRRMRNEKLYLSFTSRWDEFCEFHLRISRSEADRLIRLLDELGETYFLLSQLTRISPETYRAIAHQIHDGALHVRGEAIALCVENAREVSAAVTELRRELCPPRKKALPAGAPPPDRLQELEERARTVVADFESLSTTDRKSADWPIFCATLTWACSALRRLERQAEI
jgi:hypothetical protein